MSAVPLEAPSAQVARPRALTSRLADFWLLGGASIVLWGAFVVADHLRRATHDGPADYYFAQLGGTSAVLALLVNNPHFIASYRLAYGRGRRFILRHWFALLAVPVALAEVIWFAWLCWRIPGTGAATAGGILRVYSALGLSPPTEAGAPAGEVISAGLIDFMFLTVGWHYSRQVYGCMAVYAGYDSYPITAGQRRWLKTALTSVWVWHWCWINLGRRQSNMLGLPHIALAVPPVLATMGGLFFLVATGGAVFSLLWGNWRRYGKKPSPGFLVGWVAFVLWWVPPLIQLDFLLTVAPLFHSLQYLVFVHRVERQKSLESGASRPELRYTASLFLIVLGGLFGFVILPYLLDSSLASLTLTGSAFFTAAAVLFINIHHYFIDNVNWRLKEDPEVRRWLME